MVAKLFSRIKNRWSISGLFDKLALITTALGFTLIFSFLVLAAYGQVGLLVIKSGSMSPQVPPGSLIVFRPASIDDIAIGQIIVFREGITSNSLVIHRAVDRYYDQGKLYLKTKGDSNKRADSDPVSKGELVGVGVVIIPVAGRVLAFSKTPPGMFLLNVSLAFFLLLLSLDKVRAKERMRMTRSLADLNQAEDDLVKNPNPTDTEVTENL